jgi:hypothetical protein
MVLINPGYVILSREKTEKIEIKEFKKQLYSLKIYLL